MSAGESRMDIEALPIETRELRYRWYSLTEAERAEQVERDVAEFLRAKDRWRGTGWDGDV